MPTAATGGVSASMAGSAAATPLITISNMNQRVGDIATGLINAVNENNKQHFALQESLRAENTTLKAALIAAKEERKVQDAAQAAALASAKSRADAAKDRANAAANERLKVQNELAAIIARTAQLQQTATDVQQQHAAAEAAREARRRATLHQAPMYQDLPRPDSSR